MKERDFEKKTMEALARELPRCYLWKIHDETTGGQPDLEVAYAGHTSKLEFKVLKRDEVVHDKWEDERQLVTAIRYEQTTQRCWIVCFRKRDRRFSDSVDQTVIYRPTALRDRKIPLEGELLDELGNESYGRLWREGAIRLRGFNYGAIALLIRVTHQC